jgi:hypothetical protein
VRVSIGFASMDAVWVETTDEGRRDRWEGFREAKSQVSIYVSIGSLLVSILVSKGDVSQYHKIAIKQN